MATRLPFCWGTVFHHAREARTWLADHGYTPVNPREPVPYRFRSGDLSAQLAWLTHPNPNDGGKWTVIVTRFTYVPDAIMEEDHFRLEDSSE